MHHPYEHSHFSALLTDSWRFGASESIGYQRLWTVYPISRQHCWCNDQYCACSDDSAHERQRHKRISASGQLGNLDWHRHGQLCHPILLPLLGQWKRNTQHLSRRLTGHHLHDCGSHCWNDIPAPSASQEHLRIRSILYHCFHQSLGCTFYGQHDHYKHKRSQHRYRLGCTS